MQIKWVWIVVSPLLQILLNRFWQWVINSQTVSAIALSLKIQILVILLIIYLELLLKTTSAEDVDLFTDERQR